jgi:hypothetical protein
MHSTTHFGNTHRTIPRKGLLSLYALIHLLQSLRPLYLSNKFPRCVLNYSTSSSSSSSSSSSEGEKSDLFFIGGRSRSAHACLKASFWLLVALVKLSPAFLTSNLPYKDVLQRYHTTSAHYFPAPVTSLHLILSTAWRTTPDRPTFKIADRA